MDFNKVYNNYFVDKQKSINVITKTTNSISLDSENISIDFYKYICSIYKGFAKVNILIRDEFVLLQNRFFNGDLPF